MTSSPTYSFTLPSFEDDTTLHVRIYHPTTRTFLRTRKAPLKGAVIAHPYAPLGGNWEDHVVLGVKDVLVSRGFVVGLFCFRGAAPSQGKTSWTGHGEKEDFISVVGFLARYLQGLAPPPSSEEEKEEGYALSPIPSSSPDGLPPTRPANPQNQPIHLLLAGYSYGSLILARIPSVSAILQRFDDAVLGTAAAEMILRAKTLAKQTRLMAEGVRSARGRADTASHPTSTATRAKASPPVTIGGEEMDPAERRRSRGGSNSSRRSADFVREVPQRIVKHVRRHSRASSELHACNNKDDNSSSASAQHPNSPPDPALPQKIKVSYLLIPPVIPPFPFPLTLLPPGPLIPLLNFTSDRSSSAEGKVGAQFLVHPTLAVFGTQDTFTSGKRMKSWAEEVALEAEVEGSFTWKQIQGAGHFWQGEGEMGELGEGIGEFVG